MSDAALNCSLAPSRYMCPKKLACKTYAKISALVASIYSILVKARNILFDTVIFFGMKSLILYFLGASYCNLVVKILCCLNKICYDDVTIGENFGVPHHGGVIMTHKP